MGSGPLISCAPSLTDPRPEPYRLPHRIPRRVRRRVGSARDERGGSRGHHRVLEGRHPAGRPSRPTLRDPKQIALWTAVALVGAVGWGVLALSRGEEISAVWLVMAALGSYAIGYRFYSRFIARRVLQADDTRATPAERLEDGMDFQPDRQAGAVRPPFRGDRRPGAAGRPGAGGADGLSAGHDVDHRRRGPRRRRCRTMVILFFSIRRDGKSLGQMAATRSARSAARRR